MTTGKINWVGNLIGIIQRVNKADYIFMVNSSTVETRWLQDTVNENSDFQNKTTFSNYFSPEVFGMTFGFRITLLYCLMHC